MRINVYSQELTDETMLVTKHGTNEYGEPETFYGVRMMLHSPEQLHFNDEDDDRSGITFWLPKSSHRRQVLANTFVNLSEWVKKQIKDDDG